MLVDSPRRSRINATPLLVIEDKADHQLLIGYSLRAKVPRAKAVFASSPEEARLHLRLTQGEAAAFPRLILLDLFLPHLEAGFALLTELRTRYPRLPVIVLSSHHEQAIVAKAYDLGANAFMNKPLQLDEWESCFQILNDYWFNTITLPPQ